MLGCTVHTGGIVEPGKHGRRGLHVSGVSGSNPSAAVDIYALVVKGVKDDIC